MSQVASNERSLPRSGRLLRALCASLITLLMLVFVLDLPSYLGLLVHGQQYLALFLSLSLALIFLTIPARRRSRERSVPWYDALLAILSLAGGIYVALNAAEIVRTVGIITPTRVALGFITIALAFEAARRITGWALLVTVGIFILYAHFSYLFPGVFYERGSSWERIFSFLFLDPTSLYGPALDVIFSVVVAYVLFGNLLYATGAAGLLNDLSLALFGRYRGGPAKMTLLSGALFGTVSGSAAANVVVSGVITIPLMKRIGYSPHFAAAVEATSSSGGVLMPPVMGAAAFLMAEFLSVPYAQVALAAVIPSVLFYVANYFQIDTEAAKLGLRGLEPGEIPPLRGLLRPSLMFIVPMGVLLYFLFVTSLPAQLAALYACVAAALTSYTSRASALTPRKVLKLLEDTGVNCLQMAVIGALAGLILGVMTLGGLGSLISQSLVSLAGGNLWALLILAAVANIILGMGLPAVAIYVLLAVLVGPALVAQGVDPMAAHMFIFYFGVLSYVTPPMAFACFVAAPIAGCSPFKCGVEGMKLSIVAYVVPFLFIFFPAFLMKGTLLEILYTVIVASVGSWLLAGAIRSYHHRKLRGFEALWIGIAALAWFIPLPLSTAAGLALTVLFYGREFLVRRSVRSA